MSPKNGHKVTRLLRNDKQVLRVFTIQSITCTRDSIYTVNDAYYFSKHAKSITYLDQKRRRSENVLYAF